MKVFPFGGTMQKTRAMSIVLVFHISELPHRGTCRRYDLLLFWFA